VISNSSSLLRIRDMMADSDPVPPGAPRCLPPRRLERTPHFLPPPGSCDAHVHVFAPDSAGHLAARRSYTPHLVTHEQYSGLAERLGLERAVLVQPSVLGTNNSALLSALSEHPDLWRGIVVIPPGLPDRELADLHMRGVRGTRINRINPGGLELTDIAALGRRLEPFGWHIQLQINIEEIQDLSALARQCPVPLVIDHLGFARPEAGAKAGPFQSLLREVEEGRLWVKLSAPYRLSRSKDYEDLLPLIDALVAARPDRLLWATDWPHTGLWSDMPDDADLVDLIPVWLPDEGLRRMVLVNNPSDLYWAT